MQQVWRKRWRLTGWIAFATTTLVVLVSAVQKKNQKVCTGIEVSFNADGNNFFVDEKGAISILKSMGAVKGVPIESFDLKALEDRLERDHWIENAELFFDNRQVLQLLIEEKEPIARIFTVEGSSFYIDSACRRLPLSEKLSARIPMFTNFPSERSKLSKPDSLLLASVKELALYIQGDELWKAQVAQVNITPEGFEMIPTVGSHVVELGKDGEWQKKFDRLFSFYKQVWTKVGLEKYEKISVQYNGQVVATVKGAKPAMIDSARARIAYETLLAEIKKADARPIPGTANEKAEKDTGNVKLIPAVIKTSAVNNAAPRRILPAKTVSKSPAAKKPVVKTQPVKGALPNAKPVVQQVQSAGKPATINKKTDPNKQPKALMKKAGNNKRDD